LLALFSPGSAETEVRCDGNINGHLIRSCVWNIHTKDYNNLLKSDHPSLRYDR